MPAERISIAPSTPRAPSSRRSICSAMMLRAVLAAQMMSTWRARAPGGAAPARASDFPRGISRLTPRGHDLGQALLLRNSLGEFFLKPRAQPRRLPERAGRRRDLRHRMPSAHQPHPAHPDAKDFAVDVLGIVAAEPRDQRRHVSGAEAVELTLLDGGHRGRGLRRRLDSQASTRHWRDRVGGASVARHLAIDDYRERRHGGLGGAVVALACVAEQARVGTGIDEAAIEHVAVLVLLAPVGGRVPRQVESALEMDAEDRVEVLLAHVEDHAVAQDSGVVDHDVELAEVVQRALDDALGGLEIADALEVGARFAAEAADFFDPFLRRRARLAGPVEVAAEIVDHDLGSLPGQQQRFFAADTASGARDDRDFPIK